MGPVADVLMAALFLLWLASVAFYAISLYCTGAFFKRGGVGDKDELSELPPMTVLKPMRGSDVDTYDNLRSFIEQDYPEYEIIFGVADPDDPAARIVTRLISEFPDVRLSFVNSAGLETPNRKVANLISMYSKASHDIIVVADSDMLVGRDYLKSLAGDFDGGNAGLVTCPYRGAYPEDIGAAFEALTINTDFLPSVTVARTLEGMSFALGATMAVRREALDAIGGFEALSEYLADDYMLGNLVKRAGYEIVLSSYIVDAVGRGETFADYFAHQLRWGRTYRFCRPKGYFLSVLTKGTAFATLFLVVSGFSAGGWALFLTNLAVRYLQANHMESTYIKGPGVGAWMWLLPVKDLVSFAVWAMSFMGNEVSWKDETYRIDEGGRMVRV
jgi:ceramide glucosyltransferase